MMHKSFRNLRIFALAATLCAGSMMTGPAPAAAATNPFIAEIIMFGGNFAPQGWAFCDGQLLQIASNTALFSILGTTFGGDGQTTFGLPDLRGRVPIHHGNLPGPGLSPNALGQKGGVEAVTLTTQQMPTHTHQIMGTNSNGDQETPGGAAPARKARDKDYKAAAPDVAMHANVAANAGEGSPHTNLQPFLAVNFIIALQGTFPSPN